MGNSFIYHNEERFYYDKWPAELAKILNVSVNSLIDAKIGEYGDEKVTVATSRPTKYAAMNWQTVFEEKVL